MERRYAKIQDSYCIFSIPLLIETKQQNTVDRILVIDVPIEVQIERVTRRDGVSAEDVMAIIENQVSREARLRYADDVIDNNQSIEEVSQHVSMLHEKYLQLSLRRSESNLSS
jgi:dephospho-CoA kinase